MSLNGKFTEANEHIGAGKRLRQSATGLLSSTMWFKSGWATRKCSCMPAAGIVLSVPLALFALSGSVHAQAVLWDGSTSTVWFDDNNWSGGSVPDGTDTVDVVVGLPPITNTPVISGGDATGATLLVGDGIGSGQQGYLTIENGGTYIGDASTIGGGDIYIDGSDPIQYNGEASIVTVTGVDSAGTSDRRSTMVAPGSLEISYYNEAYLYVYDGAYVEAGTSGGVGRVFIGGPGNGRAFVTVSGVNTGGSTVYRSELISNTDIIIADTTLTSPTIAGVSAGSLSILAGGSVGVAQDLVVTVGDNTNGNVLVSGVESVNGTTYRSTLEVGDIVYLGGDLANDGGIAAVTLSEGGLMSVAGGSGLFNLGFSDTSEATINIGAASGETAVAPGELLAGLVQFGDGDGMLVFNHTDETGTYEFSPDISFTAGFGLGSIVHEAGYTVLSGDLDGYEGIIEVLGGVLGGSFNSEGDLLVRAGGVVSPGQSIGTQAYTNVTFDAGSTYLVEVDETGASDLIVAANSATLGGVIEVSGTPAFDQRYTIVNVTSQSLVLGTNGVLGTFDGLTGITDSPFIDAVLSYDPVNVFLTFTQAASLCETGVRAAVCAAVETLPDTNVILTTLLSLPTVEETADAIASLSGEIHPSTIGVLLEDGQQRVSAVNDRVQGLLPNDIDDDRGLWATGYGQWLDRQSADDTAHLEAGLGGVVAGVDREWNDALLFGLIGGYSRADIEQDGLASDASADTYSAGLYGGYADSPYVLSFGGLYNFHVIDTERGVDFTGFSDVLTARYNAHSWQAFAEIAKTIELGDTRFEPFVGFNYMGLYTEGFTEAGGDAALTASASTHHLGASVLGLRTSADLTPNVTASATGGWRHAFGDIDPETSFTLAGSDPFVVAGGSMDRHALVTELALYAALSDFASLNISYAGQFGEGSVGHGFTLGFGTQF